MCGIVGFNFSDKKLVKKMNDRLIHRGPDGEGFYVDRYASLGHRRLSIIDLSKKGSQPMKYKDYIIVYNGEIYNFPDIKKDLLLKGYSFNSNTDTEVLLYSYIEWGESCVNRFNGMWAFCIYNKKEKSYFLSRDRFGIKPLYYYWDNKKFIFASELKAVTEWDNDLKINKKALNFYFYQKYIGDDLTIYENVYKLKPGYNMIYKQKDNTLKLSRYYDINAEIDKVKNIPVNDRVKKIKSILIDAVMVRLISDVPVGSFLSGGVDSSVISAIIAENKKDFDTFSIGFKEKSYDELEYSRIVSDYINTKHHYKYLEMDEGIIRLVIGSLDEPFGDSSIIPTYLLSKITREKVTVSLSGDAADEIFGGYDTYKAYKIAELMPKIIIKPLRLFSKILPVSDRKLNLSFKIKKMTSNTDINIIKRHLNWMEQIDENERHRLLDRNFMGDKDLISIDNVKDFLSIQLNDINYYLAEDILKKVDTASMLNSLEARVPYLDYRLVPLVLSLPEKYKIKYFKTKWLLKKIALDFIPKKIINRKKRGFTSPVSIWIKNIDFINNFLTDKKYYEHGFINYVYAEKLLNDHLKAVRDNSRVLWLIFVFNYWWHTNRKK